MRSRHLRSIYLCGAALLVSIGFASAHGTAAPSTPSSPAAQTCRDRGQPRILVAVFSSKPDSIGVRVADSLRMQLSRDLCRTYFTIDGANIAEILRQSGFPPDKALSHGDIRLLGQQTGADLVIFGDAVSKGGREMEVTPMLMANFDEKIVQPMPMQSEFRFVQLSRKIETVVLEAAKQMPGFKACRAGLNDKKYDEAAKAANEAIAAYPDATMARICLAQALEFQKAAPDSILKVVGFVMERHPKDYWSTRFSERAERTKGNIEKANEHLTTLLSMNPTDVDLQEELIRVFAAAGNTEKALAVVEQSKASMPGQTPIVNLEATICFAVAQGATDPAVKNDKYACAIRAYEELAKLDTSAVNVPYFERLVRSHRELKQLKEAANAAGRGISKFPAEVKLHLMLSQMLRESGDTTAAIEAAKKALALDPTQFDIYIQIAGALGDQKVDSLLQVLGSALPHAKTAADTNIVYQLAFAPGQARFTEANNVKPDSLKTDADYEKFRVTIKLMAFAEKVAPGNAAAANPAMFFGGVSNFFLAVRAYQAAGKLQDPQTGKVKDPADTPKVCQLSTEASNHFAEAQRLIEAGGGKTEGVREVVGQVFGNILTLRPLANTTKTATCGG